VEDADHVDNVVSYAVKDSVGKAIHGRPTDIAIQESAGERAVRDFMEGSFNALQKVVAESESLPFVPTSGSLKIAFGHRANDDAMRHRS